MGIDYFQFPLNPGNLKITPYENCPIKFNCDLGEGFDQADSTAMPLIDQASIACGAHAGDNTRMQKCIALALAHSTDIGLHPSYPDRENFGRLSLQMTEDDLRRSLQAQCAVFLAICRREKGIPKYIKPHGALYHDTAKDPSLLQFFLGFVAHLNATENLNLAFMLPGKLNTQDTVDLARTQGVRLLFEGFADRSYSDSGELASRKRPAAVHQQKSKIIFQVREFCERQGVSSEHKRWLPLKINSLCFHGDNPASIAALKALRGTP